MTGKPAEVTFHDARNETAIVEDYYMHDGGWLAVRHADADHYTHYPPHRISHVKRSPEATVIPQSEESEDTDDADREPDSEAAGRLTTALESVGFDVVEAEYDGDGTVEFELGPPQRSKAPPEAFNDHIKNDPRVSFDSDTGRNEIDLDDLPPYIGDVMG